jgi:hypothetical protein
VSHTPTQVLAGAVRRALKGSGLQVTCSGSEIAVTDPREPGERSFSVDYTYRYLARSRLEYDYWHFDDLTDDEAAALIARKIRETLGEQSTPPGQTEQQAEMARREELSARVLSGELDDVSLYVRRS